MRYKTLPLVLAIALTGVIGGCSKDEQELTTEAKKYDPDVQKVREKIHRDGRITRALSKYKFAIGSYPDSKQGLQALLERPKGMEQPELWKGPYLEDPDDLLDTWGNEFKYIFPGSTHEGKYDIISFGPDGQEGTDDDLLNWDIR